MKNALLCGCVLFEVLAAYAFIIPDELPSLLSVIYSNIPTIKKGTDSRLGWGFRLGDRADFQVLVELGPQTYTQKLGNQADDSTNSKRNTIDNLSNTLYAQRQEEKKQISNTEGGKWLDQWSKGVQGQQQPQVQQEPATGLGVGEVDAKSVIPDDAILKLMELYRKRQEEAKKEEKKNEETTATPKDVIANKERTTLKPVTTTSKKDALDNVEIEE